MSSQIRQRYLGSIFGVDPAFNAGRLDPPDKPEDGEGGASRYPHLRPALLDRGRA